MDIHRARFVPYPPSAINALAFSHAQPDNNEEDPLSLRLAVGRANGNIEIWNPTGGSWLQERVLYGGKERSVEGLAWIQEPDERGSNGDSVPGRLRLFSIGYSSSVTEWDLSTGLPARHSDGSHSEVWCFAVQPKPTAPAAPELMRQDLVAGCADGTLVLLSTADDALRFDRFLARSSKKKARVLSVTYKDRNTVLAGFADSSIRVYDTRNGNVLRNIALGNGPPGGPKEILVWKVKCLANGDFVSGDSTGDIRIYDGKNYSQLQRISSHEADVLDLAVSQDGNTIFSGGMDRRTCFYVCASKKKANRGERWRKVSHKRYHDHDVKAMATYEGHKLSVVVSGGIDTQPVVLPLRHFGKELSRGLPALPRNPSLISAPNARLMVSWWNCELRIWRVKAQSMSTERPKVVARLALQGDENITSASITEDGQLLAVATANEVKIFQLIQAQSGAGPTLRIRKLELPATKGGSKVRFSADGKWLAIVTPANEVQLARIAKLEDEEDQPRVLDRLLQLARIPRDDMQRTALDGSWGSYSRSISHVAFSSGSNVLAVADLAGFIDTWVVEGHEDSTAPEIDVDDVSPPSVDDDGSDDEDDTPTERVTVFGQRWIRNPSSQSLPRLDAAPLLLSFQPEAQDASRPTPNGNPAVHPTRRNPHPHSHDLPTAEQNLLVVTSKHQLYQFEVLAGRLSDWSRRNPLSSHPSHFRMTTDDPAKGHIWDVSETNRRVWLYGEKWLFMFDLTRDFPLSKSLEGSSQEEQTLVISKKRKRDTPKELLPKANSGAGDAVPVQETSVSKIRKYASANSDQLSKVEWTDLNQPSTTVDDDSSQDKHNALANLRRSQGQDGGLAEEDEKASSDPWWHTFKYRPILGIVPMSSSQEPLEVVIVERPSWELDLPPRFTGAREQ